MTSKKTNYWPYKPKNDNINAFQRGGVVRVLLFLLLPVLPIAAFILFPSFFSSQFSFLEKDSPIIEMTEAPGALGIGASRFTVTLSDSGAGIDELVVRVTQGNQAFQVYKEKYSPRENSKVVSFDVNSKELGLREGFANVHLMAFDGSFWSNGAELNKEYRIVYVKPRVEVLTAQHNVGQGGSGLVFYRHRAGEIQQSGVMIGAQFFQGLPASNFDPEFAQWPDVYGAFFAIPKDFDGDVEKVSVVAHDVAGNQVSAPMNYRILRRKFRDSTLKINSSYVRSKVTDLLPAYFEKIGKPQQPINTEGATTTELIKGFRLVNEDYRKLLAQQLSSMLEKPSAKRYWTGAFSRAIAGSPTSSFGDNRTYDLEGQPAGGSAHDGIDLAAVANTQVHPSETGRVIFADDLGIYGNAVIIDHGLGLSTLYGHLSSILVQVGDEVAIDSVIGRSGSTGLAGGDHLHFEIRVLDRSVTPIEWWDGKWVQEHILNRIAQIKEQMKQAY